MTDTMTPAQRHVCMSHIHSKDTKPELTVRKWLWSHGYRYRLNVKTVPGKPDIVMRPYRTAIFVNGCFWHGHDCGNLRMPKSNIDFWEAKIVRNRNRDEENYRLLQENGWHVIVVWECQLTPRILERTMRKVELQLNDNMLSIHRCKPIPYLSDDNSELPMVADDLVIYGE